MVVGSFHIPQIGVAEEWQRPLDWLPIDHLVTATEQKIVILAAVFPNSKNWFSFSVGSTGNFVINITDGTNVTTGSGTKYDKSLNYADFPDSTLTKGGYKQAIITITPTAGVDLLNFASHQRITGISVNYSTTFLDCIISMPNSTSPFGSTFQISVNSGQRHAMLERVKVLSIGPTVNRLDLAFSYCTSLRIIDLNNCTGNVTNFASFASFTPSLKYIKNLNTNSAQDINTMFGQSTSGAGGSSLLETPIITSNTITNANAFAINLNACKKIGAINVNGLTGSALAQFSGLNSLEWCDMYNISETISFTTSPLLSREALVNIFNNLATVSGKTINITGCLGASSLTTAERAIATGKGWTITG